MTAPLLTSRAALEASVEKRVRDWLASTSEVYTRYGTEPWINGIVSYVVNGPGALTGPNSSGALVAVEDLAGDETLVAAVAEAEHNATKPSDEHEWSTLASTFRAQDVGIAEGYLRALAVALADRAGADT